MAIPLIVPNTLPYTIPATTLFATCVVYGRMAADNEVLVLKAAGVNTLNLLKPAILLGILTTALTGFLYYDIIPRSQQLLREQFLKDAENVLYSILKRDGSLRNGQLDYVIFVREVQGATGREVLKDVIFKKRVKKDGRTDGYETIARAQEARLKVFFQESSGLGPQNFIKISMIRSVAIQSNGESNSDISDVDFTVPLPETIFGRENRDRPSSLTWEELGTRRAEVLVEIENAQRNVSQVEADYSKLPPGPSPERELLEKDLNGKRYQVVHWTRLLKQIDTEKQIRPALAVGCLCFVLIGCPVGIWASKSDYLSVFILCFLPTMFAYYPILLAGIKMAKDGKIIPEIACWAADVGLFLGALILIWRLMRR
jgi:lipopolysaccharide export system permease protein